MTSWAYLGPEGTFAEQAAVDLADRSGGPVQLVGAAGVPAAVRALRAGEVDGAVVPLENSVEGSVATTQDELIHGDELRIRAEAFVAVTFELLVRAGTTTAGIATVGSHPHGHAQVRDWLREHLPAATAISSSSTAAAAAETAAGRLDAAVAAPMAGRRYGLEVLAHDIGLDRDAVTRFVLLSRPSPPPPPSGNDRSTFILGLDNRPGALLAILAEIAGRGINMTRLESRPKRGYPGEYLFVLDVDGHLADPALADLLAALIRRSALRRWLGSYPRAAGTVVEAPDFARPTAYRRAAEQIAAWAEGR